MAIYESTKDYGTGDILMLWDGDRPSDEDFMDYAWRLYGAKGQLEVDEPTEYLGLANPGTATVSSE